MVAPMDHTHTLATDLFGDSYTVERREFADGPTRVANTSPVPVVVV